MRELRARRSGPAPDSWDDRGAATVEFIGVTLLLLVPLIYLVIALGQVQAAAFAAESAGREAARAAAVTAVDAERHGADVTQAMSLGVNRASSAVDLIAEDFGVDVAHVAIACSSTPCLRPGSDIVAAVTVSVTLPGLPRFLDSVVPMRVTLDATGSAPIDGLAATS